MWYFRFVRHWFFYICTILGSYVGDIERACLSLNSLGQIETWITCLVAFEIVKPLKRIVLESLLTLEPLLKTFWFIAIPTSLIFIVQTIMTFVGADASDGIDADFNGDFDGTDAPFQLFTLRNLINFLLGFSWTGLSFYTTIANKPLLIGISFAVGCLFFILFFLIIRQIQKLAEDNSFKIENTLHKTAEVYLTIPENKTGKGKIMISVNGAFHELEAMTEKDSIPSGSVIKVIKIENNNILIVEKI